MKKQRVRAMGAAGLASMMLVGGVGAAYAHTVYDKGTAAYWDHGRTWGAWSYSDANSGRYEHRATANSTSSGWKAKNVRAHATHWVGVTGMAHAYWDCRG
ncbi:hypothetical protein ACTOVN_01045 [Arcanobacterium canis]